MAPITTPEQLLTLFSLVANDDRPALDRLLAGAPLRDALDQHLAELAQAAREEEGHSWASVGKAFEISKQAAQQRFGRPDVVVVRPDGTVVPGAARAGVVHLLDGVLARFDHDLDADRSALADRLDDPNEAVVRVQSALDRLAMAPPTPADATLGDAHAADLVALEQARAALAGSLAAKGEALDQLAHALATVDMARARLAADLDADAATQVASRLHPVVVEVEVEVEVEVPIPAPTDGIVPR